MPDMDGYEVLGKLKHTDETATIPVIFITGLGDAENEKKGLTIGAADYISKPFSAEIVKLRVESQIRTLDKIEQVRNLSMTDQLTGLPNRRNFDYRFSLEWEHATRNQTELALFILDIDHFKVYNDTFGHLQGDIALQSVARTIQNTLKRSLDFVARWGGEEFVVLLPMTSWEGAKASAESVRRAIEKSVVKCGDGSETKITVSIGVNVYDGYKDVEKREFLDDADSALYLAKKEGRNRVKTAMDEAQLPTDKA
jgi:diguanylate cyclase (GGDEF)-like protein